MPRRRLGHIPKGGSLETFCSCGLDPVDGHVVSETVEGQAEQVCRNIGAILSAAGVDFSAVVKTTVFLADMKDFAVVNAIYAKHFTGEPARSCVAVKELPLGLLCEIEAIAYLK